MHSCVSAPAQTPSCVSRGQRVPDDVSDHGPSGRWRPTAPRRQSRPHMVPGFKSPYAGPSGERQATGRTGDHRINEQAQVQWDRSRTNKSAIRSLGMSANPVDLGQRGERLGDRSRFAYHRHDELGTDPQVFDVSKPVLAQRRTGRAARQQKCPVVLVGVEDSHDDAPGPTIPGPPPRAWPHGAGRRDLRHRRNAHRSRHQTVHAAIPFSNGGPRVSALRWTARATSTGNALSHSSPPSAPTTE
jgi:hypothetical protein